MAEDDSAKLWGIRSFAGLLPSPSDPALYKLEFHDAGTDADTDILIDILARIVARMTADVVQLASGITSIARVGRVGEDPREDVRVGVGVVEFQLKHSVGMTPACLLVRCVSLNSTSLNRIYGRRCQTPHCPHLFSLFYKFNKTVIYDKAQCFRPSCSPYM